MPGVHAALLRTCRSTKIDARNVFAYVYASHELQATCFSDSDRCVLRVSSALVDLLAEDELPFVLGHELGHFLLGHRAPPNFECSQSPEWALLGQAAEVSADRIGLLSTPSLECAVRAIMKTTAGLGEAHLRFDATSFLGQLRHVEANRVEPLSSHPSLVVRCRALLWFSLGVHLEGLEPERISSEQLADVDKRIDLDLRRYVDAPAREAIAVARDDCLLWLFAEAVVRQGTFDRPPTVALA